MIQPFSDPDQNASSQAVEAENEDRYLPARMINEFVYCPRLFYFMHVEGQFEANAETVEGEAVHERVDSKTDALPPRTESTGKPSPTPVRKLFDLEDEAPPETATKVQAPDELPGMEVIAEPTAPPPDGDQPIHARSVTLASDELGVVAKLDLVEAQGTRATPVDYKRGRPRYQPDGSLAAWEPEQVQLCLQALVLRENGYECDQGVLYFHATRQRVPVPIDEPLIARTRAAVARAREVADLPRPPAPLVNSPKCPKCSLSAICLPDETNRCRARDGQGSEVPQVRLPATPRDDLRPLYLNTQGLLVGRNGEVLQVKEQGKVIQEFRLREINQVNLFGNIQMSTQALQALLELQIPLVLFSQRGYFYGMLQGTGLKNILLRREQFRLADDSARTLPIARELVAGKIRNQRVLLMRNHVNPPPDVLSDLKILVHKAERAERAETLLGLEGTAARLYFQQFAGMLKPGDDPIDPGLALGEPPRYPFNFLRRNRRPPRDPVNALLSLAYSLLAKDLTVTAAAVGLDPYLGFYHLPRPGRPALALDLMEPFRPLIADSAVITAINNRMIYPEHFIPAGQGVTMTAAGRKAFFRAYELRMDQLITHPLFEYRVSYRRLLEIQTRLMARVISGELQSYPTFVTR